ncbi:MAG: Zn-dependent protease [Xanthobacteraceae bacterium]|nr:MAG: Zn-dependent protease [Xanthobacteraceae bacterium]
MTRFQSGPFAPRAARARPAQQANPQATPQASSAEREHERILGTYGGVYDDPRLQALISRTVDRLVAASERPDLAYKVTILNSGSVNAFALPTGQLYVTRGLITLASDTAELSSVLSHEMAHVIARHAAIRENQARQSAVVARVVGDMGGDTDMSALALARTRLSMASFSRAQELEADGIGVGIAARAGYDPFGAVRFLTALERNATLQARNADQRALDFLSSHPATPARVQNAQSNARQFASASASEHDRDAYLSAIDDVVYGEDPSEGFVRGRRFLHPKLGFVFTAPEGFSLDNTAQAVIGVREGGTQAMRFDVVSVAAEQTLIDHLTSGWMEGIDKASAAELTINGFPAATVIAHGDQWQFRVYALRFGTNVYRFIFASRQKSAGGDQVFREAVNSFRRLSLAEIQEARPLRIRVVTVKAGDTVESLAQRMSGTDRQLERFRMLNGLGPGEAVRPDTRVKIASE